MLKKWLSYGMVFLIALQSIAAIADVHQSHQSGDEHLSFEHEHEHDQIPAKNTKSPTIIASIELPSDEFDCHHCCHCHLHLTCLPMTPLAFLFPLNSRELSGYSSVALNEALASLYRPPKT